jgi:hypothetical protein
MPKIDFKKELKHLYRPSAKQFEVVDIPEMSFLMVDGHGNPNTAQTYKEAVEGLYAVAYKLKFMSKKSLGNDFVVPPLEGLWWAKDMEAFVIGKKDDWDWTMMIMQPEWITQEIFEEGSALVKKAKNPPALSKMQLQSYDEGLSIQIMHFGSYDDEAPTLAKLHNEFIPKNNYTLSGKHHEIYLSDPRKVKPEKLKTVLRQPVRRS